MTTFGGFVRTLVMLSCLVAVPALALVGAPVSKLFRPLIDADWPGKAETYLKGLVGRLGGDSKEAAAKPAAIVPAPEILPAVDESAPAAAPPPLAAADIAAAPPTGLPGGMPAPHQAGLSEETAAPPVEQTAQLDPARSPAVQADPFQAMQHRLRELGATYYLLETWGPAGEMYRFHCRMAIDAQGLATRHFEATADDPLVAMGRVLGEIEPWVADGRR